jgi:hypothetical protein
MLGMNAVAGFLPIDGEANLGLLQKLFSRDTRAEAAIRRCCVEDGKALDELARHAPAPTAANVLSVLTKVFTVCAGGCALNLVRLSKDSGDSSRMLRAVGTDALLFEAAAWCFADFGAYIVESPQVPDKLRQPLFETLKGAVHKIGDIFGATGAGLLVRRINGAPPAMHWQERGEYFGSLLLCDRDNGSIVAELTSSAVPDIRWESGVVLNIALRFYATVMIPEIGRSLAIVQQTVLTLSTLAEKESST